MNASPRLRPSWRDLRARFDGSSGGPPILQGLAWNLAGGLGARVLTFLALIAVGRVLAPRDFGTLGVIQGSVLTAGVLARLGLGVTATRFVSLHQAADPGRSVRLAAGAPRLAFLLGAFGMLLFWIAAPWVARWGLGDPSLTSLLRLASPLLLLGAVQDITAGVLAGLESFRLVARVTTVAGSTQALGMVAGGLAGGLMGCLIGAVLGMAVGCGLACWTLHFELHRRNIPASTTSWWGELPGLIGFAIPATLAGLVTTGATWAGTAILYHQPSGDHALGIYQAAHQIRLMILFVPGLVAMAGLPMLTRLWGGAADGEYRRLLGLKLLLSLTAAALVALPAILGARWLLAAFGPGFASGAPVLQVLAAAAVPTALLTVAGQGLVSEGRMWTGLFLNLIWATVLVGTAVLWVPDHGALGLAWANLAAYGVHLLTVGLQWWGQVRGVRSSSPGSPSRPTPLDPSTPPLPREQN